MKKIIAIVLTTIALGNLLTILPAQASEAESERFCNEYGELTNSEDVLLALQNFIGEIENLNIEDLTELTEIGSRVDAGEDLADICNSLNN